MITQRVPTSSTVAWPRPRTVPRSAHGGRACAVPVTAGDRRPRHRRPRRCSRGPCSVTGRRRNDDPGHGGPLRPRGRHATADGRGERHRPQLRRAVRAHQGPGSRRYPITRWQLQTSSPSTRPWSRCATSPRSSRAAVRPRKRAAGGSSARLPGARRVHPGTAPRAGRHRRLAEVCGLDGSRREHQTRSARAYSSPSRPRPSCSPRTCTSSPGAISCRPGPAALAGMLGAPPSRQKPGSSWPPGRARVPWAARCRSRRRRSPPLPSLYRPKAESRIGLCTNNTSRGAFALDMEDAG